MKRILAVLIALTIVFSLFSGLAGADTIVYITKTGEKYHNDGCQHLSKSKISISLTDAIKRGYTPCKDCHAPSAPATHTHTWDSGKVTTAATCSKAGVRTYTCYGCEQTKTESIPATGVHTWDNGKVTTAATCCKAGVQTYTCSGCGRTKTESIPATGVHTWDKGKVTTAATCSETGVRTDTCTGCGITKTETIPKDPNAHVWKCLEVLDEPVDDQHGYGTFVCEYCDKLKSDDICPSSGFSDVKNDWTHKGIDFAVYRGITNGTDNTHFSPDATCTRGQVVTFLWRAAGCPEYQNANTPFTDVKPNAFYEKAVAWAVEHGVTSGIDKTHFEPETGCTRGQVLTFLWRMNGCPKPKSTQNSFTDVKEGTFYYQAVLWAVENNITNGMTKTTFAPDITCTRAQIVTFLYRAMR